MTVTETFFAIGARDMDRATRFYVEALGATVMFASPLWTSLAIARVRVGLFTAPGHRGGKVGLHFAVSDLEEASAAIVRAGGRVVAAPAEVAPGVVLVEAADTEQNVFTLRGP